MLPASPSRRRGPQVGRRLQHPCSTCLVVLPRTRHKLHHRLSGPRAAVKGFLVVRLLCLLDGVVGGLQGKQREALGISLEGQQRLGSIRGAGKWQVSAAVQRQL